MPETTGNFVLYDTARSYLEQMDAYNLWREGDTSTAAAEEAE